MVSKIFAVSLAVISLVGFAHCWPVWNPLDANFLPSPVASPYRFQIPQENSWFSDSFFQRLQEYFEAFRRSIADSLADRLSDIASRANTTSDSQVIDGNVVTVNRTILNEDGILVEIDDVDVEPIDRTNNITSSQPSSSTSAPSQ